MLRNSNSCLALLLVAGIAAAGEAPRQEDTPRSDAVKTEGEAASEKAKPEGGAKVISGMSILGNHEAPKSLVIVPWKSSEIGARPDLSRTLNDDGGPVDKEVFMRELAYYRIKAN